MEVFATLICITITYLVITGIAVSAQHTILNVFISLKFLNVQNLIFTKFSTATMKSDI
jgi:hypothetical protein